MIISDGINHGKLQSIIVGELKKAGLKHRLKKIILKHVKDHKTVFGAPLAKVPSCSVICCGSTLNVPTVVSEMSAVLRANAHIEGLFRKAGSQSRQKDIKRLLDAGGCVSDGHHPIDVASVLKLYLRTLPEPLISAEVQDLLLRCRLTAGEDALKPILHTLLLLPVLHVHLLHYIMELPCVKSLSFKSSYAASILGTLNNSDFTADCFEELLNFIASKHKDNLMDSSNLAIVMAPSIMPLPVASSAQRLEHHVALVKVFIENSQHIGQLTQDLISQLDDDSHVYLARRKKRRSGSLNRMLNGLRKMVSGSVNTPAAVRENKTPILSKSAAKRKLDRYEGISAKTKKEITQSLVQKELTFTPMKTGLERKRLRLSLMDARSTPVINKDFNNRINSETSISSEDLLTSSEHLFSAHDTIDLSTDMKQTDKDYVRISKQEYEEIKSRVSAIENRLSREFTDVVPRVEPLQQVQNVYEQTLEEVAMLNYPTSDHLARRLSKELKIRPNEEAKIIRSPSARKIGSIRRRSKENITKIVRHKSWNISTQSQTSHGDRFYPYIGLTRRERTSTAKPDLSVSKTHIPKAQWDGSQSENSPNDLLDDSQKYHVRKRTSLTTDHDSLNRRINKHNWRRSFNSSMNNTLDVTVSEKSINNSLDTSEKSNGSVSQLRNYENIRAKNASKIPTLSPSNSQPKWKNAAAFFMDKTGEVDNSGQTGRPSVNKLRKQNAGAVLAKAKLFESSSDKSSEINDDLHAGFARKPRVTQQVKSQRAIAHIKPKVQRTDVPLTDLTRFNRNAEVPKLNLPYAITTNRTDNDWRTNRKATSPSTKTARTPPQSKTSQSMTPSLKKSLCTPRTARTPGGIPDHRKINTPMKAVHLSPRRRSPRLKLQRVCNSQL